MLRRHMAFLLMGLTATQLFLTPTARGGIAPQRAVAATSWAPDATNRFAAATRIPSGGQSASSGLLSSTGDDYTTHSLSVQEEKMLNLLNQDRISAGLPPLTLDPELSRIARIKSRDMLDNGYFAHESPTYGKAREMLTRFGYRFSGCGENIARHATVEKAQAAFMTSEGHRRNILSAAWQKVGIGIVLDRNGHVYATQLFVR